MGNYFHVAGDDPKRAAHWRQASNMSTRPTFVCKNMGSTKHGVAAAVPIKRYPQLSQY